MLTAKMPFKPIIQIWNQLIEKYEELLSRSEPPLIPISPGIFLDNREDTAYVHPGMLTQGTSPLRAGLKFVPTGWFGVRTWLIRSLCRLVCTGISALLVLPIGWVGQSKLSNKLRDRTSVGKNGAPSVILGACLNSVL